MKIVLRDVALGLAGLLLTACATVDDTTAAFEPTSTESAVAKAPNACGGTDPLMFNGVLFEPNDNCGRCGTGTLVCDGLNALSCDDSVLCRLGASCLTNAQCDLEHACVDNLCVVPNMTLVQPGQYMRGDADDSLPFTGVARSRPQHLVSLTRSFFIDPRETTQGEFQALMGYNPSTFDSCGADCPVETVTFMEALAYANARSIAEGLAPCYGITLPRTYVYNSASGLAVDCAGYRLPTDAEWEFAYRAGTTTTMYNGDMTIRRKEDPLANQVAWYRANSGGTTHPVGGLAPNAFGLYDMGGNVQEWCDDVQYAFDTAPASPWVDPTSDPVVMAQQSGRVIRGGSYNAYTEYSRAGFRSAEALNKGRAEIGFRLVRSLPPPSCGNGLKDGDEELIDCGGDYCDPCGDGDGAFCNTDDDCSSHNCVENRCTPAGFTFVPAGEFIMGEPLNRFAGDTRASPQHHTTLTRAIFAATRETSIREYQTFTNIIANSFVDCPDSCPANTLSYLNAIAYANLRSTYEGIQPCYIVTGTGANATITYDNDTNNPYDCEGYRLPTEWEWEYLARGGTASPELAFTNYMDLYNGNVFQPTSNTVSDVNLDQIAWYRVNPWNVQRPRPVGQKAANAYGLTDMVGNINEWTESLYLVDYPNTPQIDPVGRDIGNERARRGGGYNAYSNVTRIAFRASRLQSSAAQFTGFRLVRTVAAPVCTNGVIDGDETDVDCGGRYCDPCGESASCTLDQHCESPYGCVNGTCGQVACDTDADCRSGEELCDEFGFCDICPSEDCGFGCGFGGCGP